MIIETKFEIGNEVVLGDKKYKVTCVQYDGKKIEIGLKLDPPSKVKGQYYFDFLVEENRLIELTKINEILK